jgi:nucleotide-binding universal stress UspA family protein
MPKPPTGAREPRFLVKDVLEEMRTQLEKLTVPAAGVRYHVKALHGHPVEEILGEIQNYKPSLVVMATHGRTGLTYLMLGSVAERIVRLSPAPVLTLRAG